jgi:hypothetical protein
MLLVNHNIDYSVVHMSAIPPLGLVEGNGFYPGMDGGPSSAGCVGGGADHPPQLGRDGFAPISHRDFHYSFRKIPQIITLIGF